MNSEYQTINKSADCIYSYKLVLLGDTSVGKTSLTVRFTRGQFDENQESTIGAAYSTKMIEHKKDFVKFEIWDTAGQERYHSLAPMYYRGAKVALVVYDITKYDTFKNAKKWINEIQEYNNDIIIMLIGNKHDLDYLRKVDYDEVMTYVNYKEMKYIEVSAKHNYKINEIFEIIANDVPKNSESMISNNILTYTTQPNNKCCKN